MSALNNNYIVDYDYYLIKDVKFLIKASIILINYSVGSSVKY